MLALLSNPLAVLEQGPGGAQEIAAVRGALLRLARERHGDRVADRLKFETRHDWGVLRAANDPAASGLESDEAQAWLWLAASLGNSQAINDLIGVREYELAHGPAEHATKRQDVLGQWRRHAVLNAGADMSGAAELEPEFLDDVRDPDGVGLAHAPMRPDGLVVISSIGDPSSKDGAEIMRRFGSAVGRPLDWRGALPAAGEIESGIIERWPWAVDAARMLEGRFAVLRAGGAQRIKLRPLLFYGPPGSGKTSLGRWIGQKLGLLTALQPCGGVSDSGGFAPVNRGWQSPRPSAPALQMMLNRTCNPLFVLDEIDKTSRIGGQNGSMMGVLLSMVGSDSYFDTFLGAEVDMSGVSFIGVANDPRLLDAALFDRFTPVRIDSPGPEHFAGLLQGCREDFIRENNLDPRLTPFLDEDERAALERTLATARSARTFRASYDRMMEIVMSEMEIGQQAQSPGQLLN